jgi:hypothetical protein
MLGHTYTRLVREVQQLAPVAPLTFQHKSRYIRKSKARIAREEEAKELESFERYRLPAQYLDAVTQAYPEVLSNMVDAKVAAQGVTHRSTKGLIRALY